MQITKKVIDKIDGQEVVLLKFVNDNNYSTEFCNFGGYFFSINIPKKNDPAQTEDVLLGYSSFENYKQDKIILNAIVGRVCGRIANSRFELNNSTYYLYPNAKPTGPYQSGFQQFLSKWGITHIQTWK